jgi:hypothetical protein
LDGSQQKREWFSEKSRELAASSCRKYACRSQHAGGRAGAGPSANIGVAAPDHSERCARGRGRKGEARQGKARQGKARQGTARHSTARQGKARNGTTLHDTARHGTARHGKAGAEEPLYLGFYRPRRLVDDVAEAERVHQRRVRVQVDEKVELRCHAGWDDAVPHGILCRMGYRAV